jgi:hypothetical protein
LSDQVTSAEILRTVLANAGHPGGAVHELIEAANRAGGKDNVSVLMVEGEQFAAAREASPGIRRRRKRVFAGKPAMFVYGWCAAFSDLAGCAILGAWWIGSPRSRHHRRRSSRPRRLRQHRRGAREGPAGRYRGSLSGEYPEQLRLKNGVTVRGRLPDVPILRAASDRNRAGRRHRGGGRARRARFRLPHPRG